eukprot:4524889-Amphidinium_carterae.1
MLRSMVHIARISTVFWLCLLRVLRIRRCPTLIACSFELLAVRFALRSACRRVLGPGRAAWTSGAEDLIRMRVILDWLHPEPVRTVPRRFASQKELHYLHSILSLLIQRTSR